jgi:hypothetical protein
LDVKVLDGLLPIHHFTRKRELRVAVINVHGCIHVPVVSPTIIGGVAVKDESNQGQSGDGEGEGSERDDTPVGETEQAPPGVAVGAPERLRFCDESEGEKMR